MITDGEINCVYLAALLKARHPSVFADLQQVLQSHGVKVCLLTKAKDIWAKDYCPVQTGPGQLVQFRYEPDYLKDDPELKTGKGDLECFRDVARCRHSRIVLDGGNIVASKTAAILTDKVYKENPDSSRSDLRDKLQKLLQVDRLIVIPREPFDPIGHADAMVRFIDENTVLVNDYTAVDPGFGERLIELLRRHELAIKTLPYFHEKRSNAGIPSAVGCFTNFLRTEKLVVAPIYGSSVDDVAVKQLELVFPDLSVVSLDCTNLARDGGALNCVSASYRVSQETSCN